MELIWERPRRVIYMPGEDRPVDVDLRLPGEAFCRDCPDHEGCMQGIPCGLAKRHK